MRYVGQEHAVTVDLPLRGVRRSRTARRSSAISTRLHALRYGTSAPDERAEIVSLRTTVTGLMRKPPQGKISARPAGAAQGGVHRQAAGLFRHAASRRRRPGRAPRCWPATASPGPALIEEHASTTVLMPGDALEVDAYGNLVIAVAGAT